MSGPPEPSPPLVEAARLGCILAERETAAVEATAALRATAVEAVRRWASESGVA